MRCTICFTLWSFQTPNLIERTQAASLPVIIKKVAQIYLRTILVNSNIHHRKMLSDTPSWLIILVRDLRSLSCPIYNLIEEAHRAWTVFSNLTSMCQANLSIKTHLGPSLSTPQSTTNNQWILHLRLALETLDRVTLHLLIWCLTWDAVRNWFKSRSISQIHLKMTCLTKKGF